MAASRRTDVHRARRQLAIEDLRAQFSRQDLGCSSALAKGLHGFTIRLTPSHTLRSRRHSIWSLLKMHVDSAWTETARAYGASFKGIPPGLIDMKVSCCGATGILHLQGQGASRERIADSIETWIKLLQGARRTLEAKVTNGSGRRGLDEWIAPRRSGAAKRPGHDKLLIWLGSMNALIYLLRNLQRFDSGYGRSEGDEWSLALRKKIWRAEIDAGLRHEEMDPVKLSKVTGCSLASVREEIRSRDMHAATLKVTNQYCRICWRETTKYAFLRQLVFGPYEDLPASGGALSRKYCWLHMPKTDGSRYWVDRRREGAINAQRLNLYKPRKAAFVSALIPKNGVDDQEARKLAYDLNRNRLRSDVAPESELKLRDRVALLMGKGFSQSEIARRCGVSRQAVNKVVKRLKEIWLAGRREIDCLNPVTNEIMEWDVLLGRVQELLAEGCPRADIATRLGVYRHTVDAMVQRLQR